MNKMMLVLALWAALLLGGGLPAAATKAVPQNSGDTLCVAPLTVEGVALFNQTLERFGHYDMTVVSGDIYATPNSLKKGIYVVKLKCRGPHYALYFYTLAVESKVVVGISCETTGAREFPI